MDKKIVKYTSVLRCISDLYKGEVYYSEFDAEINELIEKGYQPFGALQVLSTIGQTGGYIYYIQAMVKYE